MTSRLTLDQGNEGRASPSGRATAVEPQSVSPLRDGIPDAGHTPGRWALSEDGERVITLTCPDDGGDIICEFPDAESSNSRWPANARLIASAPELLEALEALDEHWLEAGWAPPNPNKDEQERRMLAPETLDIWRTIRAVIAKARGQ